MTQMPAALPPHEQHIETIIRDEHGREILRTGMTVTTIMMPDGSLKEQKISEDIETVDGVSWNPAMRFGPNSGGAQLVACSICRSNHSSHGLCTSANIRRCHTCQKACCPCHSQLCSDDRFRCPKCARRYRWRTWLTCLISVPVEG